MESVRARLPPLDVALALVVAVLAAVDLAQYAEAPRAGVVALTISVPVLIRSAAPVPAGLLAGLVLPGVTWAEPTSESLVAVSVPFLVLYAAGRRQGLLGAGATYAACVAGIGMHARTWPGFSALDAVAMGLALAVAVAVGRASREMLFEADALRQEGAREAARAEQERVAAVESAIAQERLRVAREIHDVLGHAVSVMGLQAAGVRRRLRADQEVEAQALRSVERAGREAVEELRRLLGVLRAPDEGPEEGGLASAARAAALVDEVRAAGLHVETTGIESVDSLPPALALTVVRVVQEGLTNALRHAPGARAEVRVERADGWLTVAVEDDGGTPTLTRPRTGTGLGLVGMTERVSMFGGELRAGPRRPRGFALTARLPEPGR